MEIRVKNASKTIKGKVVLSNINLTMQSGMVYGLQGPNGSGKTMLMRLISGLIRPTSGVVEIDGKILGKNVDFPESLGLLIESPVFLPNHTGKKNLELLAQIKGLIDRKEIDNAIRRLELAPDDKRVFHKYSLGMKQRLGIAAAIMEHPDLLILDEPTNALDERGVDLVRKVIWEERDRGALVILACHDSALLEGVADELYRIDEGKINTFCRT